MLSGKLQPAKGNMPLFAGIYCSIQFECYQQMTVKYQPLAQNLLDWGAQKGKTKKSLNTFSSGAI
jgi:hypothetical protein